MKNSIILGFVLCFVFAFSSCSTGRQSSNLSDNSSSVKSNLSGTAISTSTIWKDLVEGKSDIGVMYGCPGILLTANDENTMLKQIGTFLEHSIPYTKSVPKSGDKPYDENAGYMGPPVLTISNKNHKIIINPAWYVETPGDGQFKVQDISGVIEVNIDGQITYVQSQTFYDWMYNGKLLPSFHN
jgi:hypothetical protein